MYYPRFWRRSSIGLVTLISLLALAIACGSAARAGSGSTADGKQSSSGGKT